MRFALFLFSIATTTTTTTLALECNICGPGTDNVIGKPKGILTLDYDGVARKQNCLKWQEGSFLDEEWCRINIMNFTVWPCGCLLSDGTTLMDVLEQERQDAEDEEETATGTMDNGDLPDPVDRPDGGSYNQDDDEEARDNSAATGRTTVLWSTMSVVAAALLAAAAVSL